MATQQELAQPLRSALSVYPQDPGAAIQQLQPFADDGNVLAQGLMAWMLLQQGRPAEGADHALAAGRAGAGQLALLYAQNLMASADPALRERASELFRVAQQFPSVLDPFSLAVSAVQQGNLDVASELLGDALTPPLASVRDQAERMVEDAEHRLRAIGEFEARAHAEAERVGGNAREALDAIERERLSVVEIARQTGLSRQGRAPLFKPRATALEPTRSRNAQIS